MQFSWKEIIRFGIVGVIATAIHYVVYLLCQLVLTPNIAYTTGWVISLACNLWLSARYTFRRNLSVYRTMGFIGCHILNYLLHIGIFNLLLWLGMDKIWAPLVVFCIVIPVNFILVRLTFHKLP